MNECFYTWKVRGFFVAFVTCVHKLNSCFQRIYNQIKRLKFSIWQIIQWIFFGSQCFRQMIDEMVEAFNYISFFIFTTQYFKIYKPLNRHDDIGTSFWLKVGYLIPSIFSLIISMYFKKIFFAIRDESCIRKCHSYVRAK